MKKLALLLALVLAFGTPAQPLAAELPAEISVEAETEAAAEETAEPEAEETEAAMEEAVEEITAAEETEAQEITEPETEEVIETAAEVSAIETIGTEEELLTDELDASESTYLYEVTFEQKTINFKEVNAVITNLDRLVETGMADEVTLTYTMTYNGKVTQQKAETFTLADLTENTITLEVPAYGKYSASAEFFKEGRSVSKLSDQIVGVTAEEYNFAGLNATFPVVQFTLSLWDITGNSEDPVPTFVVLSRNDAYDWSQLPENTYELPYLEYGQRTSVNFVNRMRMMQQYIKELYECNPDSKFNYYCVDISIQTYLWTMVENNIPAENISLKVLSDGTASYQYFNDMFNNDDPQSRYDELAAVWRDTKAEYAKGNEIDLGSLPHAIPHVHSSLKWYAYTIIQEERNAGVNVEWWLARTSGTLMSGDADFLAKATATTSAGGPIVLTNFNTMLNGLKAKGAQAESEFKKLYHFSETMFSEAEQSGKKVMMFLGTRVTNEQNIGFADYARLCMLFYGDDYVYYYKGHPATPTAMYPAKQEELDALGIIDVESSIAAELILYFYPDIYMSGYDSTTFISASKETACCLFNITLAKAFALTNGNRYEDEIDMCASKITTASDSAVQALANAEHTCYLLEYNKNVVESEYDIAVYDATDATLMYYAKDGDSYILKKTESATRPIPTVTGGQNQTTLTWSPVKDATEYRVYQYNQETGKYTRLTTTKDTTYVHTGLEDGTTYTYLVRAMVNGTLNNYNKSQHVSATTVCAAPSVTVKATTNSLTLNWNEVPSATQYRIYSYDPVAKSSTRLATVKTNSYTISGLESGESYTYLVRATNGTVYSAYTAADRVTGTTLCEAPAAVAYSSSSSEVVLTWRSVAGAVKYRVYSYDPSTKKYTGIVTTADNTTKITGLSAGTTYQYLVRAYNGTAYSSYTTADLVAVKTICAKPAVTAAGKSKSVTLTWKKVTGATKYRIFQYNTSTKKYTRLADTTALTYTVSGLKTGTTYSYLVRAYNGSKWSSYTVKDVVSAAAK